MKSTTLVLGAVAAVVLSSGAAFAGTKPATAPTAPAAASTMAPAHHARSHHRAPAATPAHAPTPVVATPKKN